MSTSLHAAPGSTAEDLFIDLFSDTFGAEKAGYLYSQYHFFDSTYTASITSLTSTTTIDLRTS